MNIPRYSLILIGLLLLEGCRKNESEDLKAIRQELEKSDERLEAVHRNQIKEREGKAIENMKSYFE